MSPFTPKRSAMDLMRSGRNVPATNTTFRIEEQKLQCQSTFGINICYLEKSQYNGQRHEFLVSTPFLQHRRSPGVVGLLHSWYVRAESFLCDILHRLLRWCQKKKVTQYELCFPSVMDCEISPPVKIRHNVECCQLFRDLPPSMVSTALLPVLTIKTRLRFSWSSRPVANEDPLILICQRNR